MVNNKNEVNNKLNVSLRELMKSNIQIRKENRILEKEINNYKKQFFIPIYKKYNNIPQKDYEYYKKRFQSYLSQNSKLLEKILEIQEKNKIAQENVNNLYKKNYHIFKIMERRNRQNAEIEITNEENESIYNSLKEKNELFKKEVKRLENELAEIKNRQNNLNMLKQSEMKKIIDREDII